MRDWIPLTALGGCVVVGVIIFVVLAASIRVDTAPAWPVEESGHHKCPVDTAPTVVQGGTDAWFIICRPTPEVCRNSTD